MIEPGSDSAGSFAGSVVVTGAGGFIGSHLVEELARRGAEVRAFVRYNSRNDYGWLEAIDPQVADSVEVFRGDLVNPEAVARAADGRDVIFHLGALIPIPYSYVHPREFVSVNTVGTLNVLEAARRHGTKRLVHTSTSEVYGTALRVPIDEEHPLQAQSPYAATKIGADQLALSYFRSFGLPAVVARPFNTYGPRQSARAVIPTIITQALSRDQIEIGSLSPTRDFVFVEDIVAGMIACAESPGIEGEVINLGTGVEVTIAEVLERVLAAVGRDLRFEVAAERQRPPSSEVEQLLADARAAERLLGWKASVSLEDGLARTIDWMRGSLETYKPSHYNV
ncbi:NAD-dependent 4,6-dehydratase LegB [soil metagenome]